MTNKELCEKFSFLIPTNRWTGKVVKDYDYSWTELDAMPDGWRKAFGEKICEEIKNELNKLPEDIRKNYHIIQIKEKYGYLCWYDNWHTEEIRNVLNKYERLSERTCIKCGAAATKISDGWISPYCDSCASLLNIKSFIPIDKYLEGVYEDEDEEISI